MPHRIIVLILSFLLPNLLPAEPTHRPPGVYVEEIPGGARPIQAVGTSTAAFLGKAPLIDAKVNKLVWINNWTEFRRVFVLGADDPKLESLLPEFHSSLRQ